MTERKAAPATETAEELKKDSNSTNSRARRTLGKRRDIPSLALVNEATTRAYHEVYKVVFGKGALDRKTKELIAIGAAAVTGCQGCLTGHLRKAKALGVTRQEIEEAIGVAFSVNAATVVDRADIAAATLALDEED
jgi:AhpD family alkylhydroperoxidase